MIEQDQPSNIMHLVDDELNEYLDGYLDPNEIAIYEAHIKSCVVCAARLEGLQTVFYNLETLPDVSLERDLSSWVVSAIQPELMVSPRLKWGVFTQAVLALIILGLVVPPLINTWQPVLLELQHTWSRRISETMITWTADWSALLAGWQLSLTALLSEWQPPSLIATAHIVIWPVFLAALLLFIIGNGLVLRKITHNNVH